MKELNAAGHRPIQQQATCPRNDSYAPPRERGKTRRRRNLVRRSCLSEENGHAPVRRSGDAKHAQAIVVTFNMQARCSTAKRFNYSTNTEAEKTEVHPQIGRVARDDPSGRP